MNQVQFKLPDTCKTECQKAIDEAMRSRLRFIMENRARLIDAWFAETGVHPSEAVLVEQRTPEGSIQFWIRKKTEKEMAGEAEDLTNNPHLCP
jgi:hypothetical protein